MKKKPQKKNIKPRVVVSMNTGSRRHKSKKDYDRKSVKKELQSY